MLIQSENGKINVQNNKNIYLEKNVLSDLLGGLDLIEAVYLLLLTGDFPWQRFFKTMTFNLLLIGTNITFPLVMFFCDHYLSNLHKRSDNNVKSFLSWTIDYTKFCSYMYLHRKSEIIV